MRNLLSCLLLLCLLIGCTAHRATPERHFPPGTQRVIMPPVAGVHRDVLQNITPVVTNSIASGYYPGAVVLASHQGHIIYQGVFGNQSIIPTTIPMRYNTIFDIASLTKVVATTPAIMQLIEKGKLKLDAPVAQYWPAFAYNGKEHVTIRELLTHTSGLQADLPDTTSKDAIYDPRHKAHALTTGEQTVLKQIVQLKLKHPAGTHYIYSDINFIVLSHLVFLRTGERLDTYAQQHIFKPLKMQHTFFIPSDAWKSQIAPTEVLHHTLRYGTVHDYTAYTMGGVSGHAGLFSTAQDLNRYTQCLLNQGRINATSSQRLFNSRTILSMELPQVPAGEYTARSLGWEVNAPYANNNALYPISSFGHTGWTGTSLWIDPNTDTALIILTSRTHPTPTQHNKLIQDRRTLATIVANSLINTDAALSTSTSGS